jgi:hypothetical protein
MTGLHIAIRNGHIPIVNYFLRTCPPTEREYTGIYATLGPQTALSLALDSNEPEIVALVLENSLSTTDDVHSAWARMSSSTGLKKSRSPADDKRRDEIRRMLMSFGGFTPPPTPTSAPQGRANGQAPERESSINGSRAPSSASKLPPEQQQKGRPTHVPRPSQERNVPANGDTKHGHTGRGRGRGRA